MKPGDPAPTFQLSADDGSTIRLSDELAQGPVLLFFYPLLADSGRSVAKAYGVKRPGPLFNKRMTFVIGQDGPLLDVIASETNMDSHADKALATLRAAG